MAEVWFCKEGPNPARGGPQYVNSVEECVQALDLKDAYFYGDLKSESVPRFNVESRLGSVADYAHVVVKLLEKESRVGLPSGFYILPLKPHEVTERLGRAPAPAVGEGSLS